MSEDTCRACGHDRIFHQVGTGDGVPLGQQFCDDRHGDPCDCRGFNFEDKDATIAQLTAERDSARRERDEAVRILDDARVPVPSASERSGMTELACRVSLLRARAVSLEVDRVALREQLASLRAALVEACDVIDDWPDCPGKSQYTNTIDYLRRLAEESE